MVRAASMVVMVAAVAAALPSPHDRYIDNPKTANQVLDNIIEKTVERIQDLKWDESKKGQNGEAELPMHEDTNTNESLKLTSVSITGLGSLTRSKSASFNADKTELTGTIVLRDAKITGSYDAYFPGVDEAPPQEVSGSVTETVSNLFADIVVRLDSDLVPKNIKSYSVRCGHDEVDATGLGTDNTMEPLHLAGFRKALRQTLENTMDTNIKVQINQAIQEMKAEASD